MTWNTQIFCIAALFVAVTFGATIVRQDEHQVKVIREQLDDNGKYFLSWEVDFDQRVITFEAEVETLGYVGFGVSPSGGMAGADIFMAGVFANKTNYAFDMYAEAAGRPSLDEHEDWTLEEAREEGGKTIVKFSRKLNTCDDKDYPIGEDTVRLIWSFGATDDIEQHTERGTKSVNLLMPDTDNFDPAQYDHWDILSPEDMIMPALDTTYWCNVRKAPAINEKRHIVAFDALLDSDAAKEHTHHFVIYKCVPPEGQTGDQAFAQFLDKPGFDCYDDATNADYALAIRQCMGKYVYVWSKGGKRMLFPEDVGHPFPEQPGQGNYYMFEVHIDNPSSTPDVPFQTAGRVYYTKAGENRDIEAGMVTVSHGTSSPAITIPPNSVDFIVTGHCAGECTDASLPDDGVKVFNSLLHSHLSGTKLKVRHMRGSDELPWLDYDDHYDFNFQQNKPLREPVDLKKGDQLTVECTYDTTWNDGKVVVGGLSTREEMCFAFLWYYPLQDGFFDCSSDYSVLKHFEELGVTNFTDYPGPTGLPRFTILEPENLAGDYIEVLSDPNKFNWTEDFVRQYENNRRYGEHAISCGKREGNEGGVVKFPENLVEYVPEDQCKRDGGGGGAGVPSSALHSVFGISLLLAARNFF